jgi:hypothetical protein
MLPIEWKEKNLQLPQKMRTPGCVQHGSLVAIKIECLGGPAHPKSYCLAFNDGEE